MPRKMVRSSGPVFISVSDPPLTRSMSCTGIGYAMSTCPESRAATRVASDAIGVNVTFVRLCLLPASFHQSGLASATVLTPASRLTRRNGPVPLALRVVCFSCSPSSDSAVAAPLLSDQLFDMMYQLSHSKCRIGFGCSVMKSTVWSSTLTTSAMPATVVFRFEPGPSARSAENTTSSAVKSSPLWNFTPLRR